MIPNILSIAGSDSSGGAGIQADIKSISAAGGYAMTAITALTAQNTQGVTHIHAPAADFLDAQLSAIATDIRIHAIKIGMLTNADNIAVVRKFLAAHPQIPTVVDPVMIATSGARLLDEHAMHALTTLLPQATVITPNLPELAVITGQDTATSLDHGVQQARDYQSGYADGRAPAVLVKGGHLTGRAADNILVSADGSTFRAACTRIDTPHTHGTGCSLSSAIATRLGCGDTLEQAVAGSTEWLHGAIAAADHLDVGHGNGPVHHFHRTGPDSFTF